LQVELNEQLRNQIVSDLFSEYLPVSEEVFAAELYLNLDQVRLMRKEGMCFGIHGYEHYWMDGLSQKDLEEDINSALEVFNGIVDRNNWICCYPYGSYNDDVIRLIRKKGAAIGLTTDVNIASLDYHNRYKLPRFDTNDFPPKSFRYKGYLISK
jgi:peptidoglycan/xylan/chitin deacetylase (PgdA/CDA1 family)